MLVVSSGSVDRAVRASPARPGRYELRAFSDDPIILWLDQDDGHRLGTAVAEVLAATGSPGTPRAVHLTLAGRAVAVRQDTTNGLRILVARTK